MLKMPVAQGFPRGLPGIHNPRVMCILRQGLSILVIASLGRNDRGEFLRGLRGAVSASTSFRDLIGVLRANGTLRSVSRAVEPRYELIAIMRAVQKAGNEPLLFRNVTGSPAPVATNILGRRDVLALALGLRPETLLASLVAQEAAQSDPVIVSDAPVHQVVRTVDLDIARELPQVVHSERDAGAYISAGICIARHPVTGTYNASWNRIQLVGGDHTRVRMMPPQHLGQYQSVAEQGR